MNFDEFYSRVLEIMPGAEVGEDNEGQLIIYTNFALNENDEVVLL